MVDVEGWERHGLLLPLLLLWTFLRLLFGSFYGICIESDAFRAGFGSD